MPANWAEPTLASSYADFLDKLTERDTDSLSMFAILGTNIPEGAMRYVRASNKFQEYLSGVWVDKVLSVAGGGTGATTGGDAVTNLGLGTMALQNANAVNITGGVISGLSSLAINGSVSVDTDLGVTNDLFVSGDAGVTGSITSTAGFSGPGGAITNLNASNLATGTVPVARLGTSGAVGAGLKFLADNNTWKFAGGMVEIFHGDVAFGTSDLTHNSTITWTGGTPASLKELSFILDGPMASDGNGNADWHVSAEFINVTTLKFYKAKGGGTGTAPNASGHFFTAFWHRVENP